MNRPDRLPREIRGSLARDFFLHPQFFDFQAHGQNTAWLQRSLTDKDPSSEGNPADGGSITTPFDPSQRGTGRAFPGGMNLVEATNELSSDPRGTVGVYASLFVASSILFGTSGCGGQ